MADSPYVETIVEPRRAEALLNPLRLRVMQEVRRESSATEIAARLGETRQKVNYHVKELARHGFLEPGEERRRGNLIEQRWRATARSWLLAPEIVGALAPDPDRVAEEESVDRVLALAARLQSEVGRARAEAADEGKRLPTLSIETSIRFTDADERAAFAVALREAIAAVVARFTTPEPASDEAGLGEPDGGRPYRLIAACHPVPPKPSDETKPEETDERS